MVVKMHWQASSLVTVFLLFVWTILVTQASAQIAYNVTTTKNTTTTIYRAGPASYRRNIGGRPYPSIIQVAGPGQNTLASPASSNSGKKTSIQLPPIVVTSRPFGSVNSQSRRTTTTTTTTTTPSSLVDKSTPNIPFFTISCSVGKPCSRIISSNHVKTARPTFKPYTKEDYEKFKGPLSALFPPSKNKITTTPLPSTTTTPRPRTRSTTTQATTPITTTTTTTTTTTAKPEKINPYTLNFGANKYSQKPEIASGYNKRPERPSATSAPLLTSADLEYDPFSFNKPLPIKQPWIWPVDRNTHVHNEDINNSWHKKPTWVNGKLTYRPASPASTEATIEKDNAPTAKPTVHYSNKANFYSSSYQPQPYRTKTTQAPFYQSWNNDNRQAINYAPRQPIAQSYSTYNDERRDPWYADRTVTASATNKNRNKPHPLLITRNNVEALQKPTIHFDVPPEVSISSAQVQLQVLSGPKARVIDQFGHDIETDGESVNLTDLIMSHYPVSTVQKPSRKRVYSSMI